MRILLISDHADPLVEIGSKEAGGQNIYVYYLSKFLGKMGFFVDVFTRWDRKNKKEIVKINNKIRVIRIKAGPKKYIPRDNLLNHIHEFTENIFNKIKKEKSIYDIIHTNYWFSGLIGLKIAKKMNLPIAHVFHSIGKLRFEALKKFKLQKKDYAFFQKRLEAEEKIAKSVNKIISTSPIEKKLIMKFFKIDEKSIQIIPIGVDTEIFKPIDQEKSRRFLKIENNRKIILYVGRIEWRKGIGTLLFAFKEVLKKYSNAKLYIIGGGKSESAKKLEMAELNRLKNICSQLEISNNVCFLGPVNQKELFKYYSASDVVVVPSYYEPFGIVPLEAMACGTPVVASNVGGLRFTVQDKITGHLVKPRDYKKFAEKISYVLKNKKEKYFEKCLKRIKENFLWENIAIEYIYFFNNLIKEKKKL